LIKLGPEIVVVATTKSLVATEHFSVAIGKCLVATTKSLVATELFSVAIGKCLVATKDYYLATGNFSVTSLFVAVDD
jgi:hypothetical protein